MESIYIATLMNMCAYLIPNCLFGWIIAFLSSRVSINLTNVIGPLSPIIVITPNSSAEIDRFIAFPPSSSGYFLFFIYLLIYINFIF